MVKLTAENLAAFFAEICDKYASSPAFATRNKEKIFEEVNYQQLYNKAAALATALIERGLKPEQRVGLISDNRFEWILSDMAVILAGGADVPRGTDINDHDLGYILAHSDSRFAFIETGKILERCHALKSKLKEVKGYITFDKEAADGKKAEYIYDLIAEGEKLRASGDRRVEERIAAIDPAQILTIIYTSGTTGLPKGVVLSHANMISQIRNVPIKIGPNERFLSILPVWHIFERMFEMVAMSHGACTYYTNLRNIKEDLSIVRPTFMASSPRLWEKVYMGIMKKVKDGPAIKRKLFKAATFCSARFRGATRFLSGQELDTRGRSLGESLGGAVGSTINVLLFAIPYFFLDKIVLGKIRAATGGAMKKTCSGGGALPYYIDEFYDNIGIPIYEGYGLTETSPVLAVRVPGKMVLGTVGAIWPHTELRIVDISNGEVLWPTKSGEGRGKKGEVHVRGSQVMRGYHKNSEATEKVLKDGWLNTGDIGMMTFNDCLKLYGRTKETVVLLGGENVEPTPIETKIQESPYIDQCMVVGQDQKTLGALIVPSLETLGDFGSTLAELAKSDKVRELIKEDIRSLVSSENGYRSFEKVIDFVVIAKEFEVGDEMTNTFKLKRHIITEKYSKEIASLYK